MVSKGFDVAAVTGRHGVHGALAGRLVTRLVSCECSIRLIEFAKSREVVAMATGDPAEDRGAGVTMATGMAVAGVACCEGLWHANAEPPHVFTRQAGGGKLVARSTRVPPSQRQRAFCYRGRFIFHSALRILSTGTCD